MSEKKKPLSPLEYLDFSLSLRRHKNILLCLHDNVDPDSLCSNIAMATILRESGHHTKIAFGSNKCLPPQFNFLSDIISWAEKNLLFIKEEVSEKMLADFDCFLMLDTGSEDRVHKMGNKMTLPKFVMDHHAGNNITGYQARLLETSASSTCEMVLKFLDIQSDVDSEFESEIFSALYMGIYSDTMGFKTGVTKRTLEILAKLYQPEIDTLVEAYNRQYSIGDLEWARKGLDWYGYFDIDSYKVVVALVSLYDKRNLEKRISSTDLLLNTLNSIGEFDIVIVADENSLNIIESEWRVRVRSFTDKPHARLIAEVMGGSGHDNASGAKVKFTNTEKYPEHKMNFFSFCKNATEAVFIKEKNIARGFLASN